MSNLMTVMQKRPGAWAALALCLLMAVPAFPADLIDSVEGAYAARQLRRTQFDPGMATHEVSAELRFLEDLFLLTDEASLLNANVGLWLMTDGVRGLHATDYRDRMEVLRVRLEELESPDRVRSVRDLLSESLTLQQAFVNDWYQAIEAGRPFSSQLTDENAYHEGLHRSHRIVLKAYAELHALFPEIGESSQRAFLDHLRAMDLK
jgi:hypothetical protein